MPILDEIKPPTAPDQAARSYLLRFFLAGPSGSGKTTSAMTVPGPKLVVDFDGRSASLAGFDDVSVLDCVEADHRSPRAWDRAERIRKELLTLARKPAEFPYSLIFFDGLTSMNRISLNWALLLDSNRGLGGAPARQHFLPQMDALAKFMLSTLSLPCHVGYSGHMELIEDEERGTSILLPKTTGKLRTELANWFNETYYCYRQFDAREKKTRYYWLTAGTGRKDFFKSSLNQRGKFWGDPIELDFDSPRVGFTDLLQRRFGEQLSEIWTGAPRPSDDEGGDGKEEDDGTKRI